MVEITIITIISILRGLILAGVQDLAWVRVMTIGWLLLVLGAL